MALVFAGLAITGLLASGPAFAVSGYSTTHLNLRSGPGTQYPVEGVMNRNVRSEITGCLANVIAAEGVAATDLQRCEVPGSAHGFAVLDYVPVLVDVNARTLVYIHRA